MKSFVRFLLVAALVPILLHGGEAAISSVSAKLHELSESGRDVGHGRGARVVSVVDGDTLNVTLVGKPETVRLIGIDTPETKRPGVSIECGGPEASESMHELISPGDQVELLSDTTQDDRDIYGRLLRYVELDGEDVAREQLARGWAEVYVFDSTPYERLSAFKKASAGAQDHARGAWGACAGDFHSAS